MPRWAPLSERFWSKVDRSADCWLWTGRLDDDGYGTLGIRQVHRIAYELTHGPIPAGMTIDHLCRTRACVRPIHLEPITMAVNYRRGYWGTRNESCVKKAQKRMRQRRKECV